jgi:trimethylamine--corrinoid protein Co-methyltransferase
MGDRLRLRLLSSDEVGLFREKCLSILSRQGVKVDHYEVLGILAEAGAEVDRASRQVRFPVDFIETALAAAPSTVTIKGADERHDCPIPHPGGLFYTSTNVQSMLRHDPDTKRFEDVTAESYAEWCRLIEVLEHVNLCAIQTPMDVPPTSAEVHALNIQLQNTTKPLFMHAFSHAAVPYMFELMSARMGGVENLKERSLAIINPGTVSPFVLKAMDMEEILQACRHGVPVTSDGHVIAGATGPVTMAGTVLQNCAEVLAHIVIAQTIKPGHPIMMTMFNLTMDMTTGFSALATPAANLARSAGAQVCKEGFGIPVTGCALMTDAYVSDGLAVTEKALGALVSVMAGMDLVYGVGRLGGASLASPVQLVIDDQLIGVLKEYVSGLHVDDELLALDEILDTGIGGHFLKRRHTLRHCRDMVEPELFRFQLQASWETAGEKDLYERAAEEYRRLRADLAPVDIAPDVKRDMDDVVARADAHLAS